MMRPKGMQHIRSMRSVVNRSQPANRAQIASQLARLEHEKARLDRELSVWEVKVQQTAEKRAALAAQTAALQTALARLDNTAVSSDPSSTMSTLTLEY